MNERIRVPTRTGAIELEAGVGECTGCQIKGGGLVDVTVTGEGGPAGTVAICGNCLAEGLAIMLGRRHVQAGGSVEDLTGQ